MIRLTFLTIVAIASLSVRAQIPQKFNYQAIVRGNAGMVIANKPLGMRFSIRDGSATGTVQYSETQLTTSNAYGLVNLQVGGGTVATGTLASVTWNTGNKFLQIEVDTTGSANYVALATVELITVPYALQAQQAVQASRAGVADSAGVALQAWQAKMADSARITDSARAAGNAKVADSARAANTAVAFSGPLAGDVAGPQGATVIQTGAVTTAKLADNSVTAAKIPTGQVIKSITGLQDNIVLVGSGGTSLSVSGNAITVSGASGTITNVTAGAGLTGGGNGSGTAGVISLAADFGGDGNANTVSRSDHDHIGQFWYSPDQYTLGLVNTGNTSPALYIQSYASDINLEGLLVDMPNSNSQSLGIFTRTNSGNTNAAGILGQASADGPSPGNGAKGVWGVAGANNTFGVVGSVGAGRTGCYAGYFGGNVMVAGTLSKSGGSFKIDHPLDPANKYLSHSFVESPDMMNIYNGNIVLDGGGEATVMMPDWFEALNKDFRYQLTAIGKPSPNLYIAEEISGNRFRIAGGSPGAKVSWTVTGIRHDAYANAHRIPVEEVKNASERGKYLTPEVFGKTAQQGIFSVSSMIPPVRQPRRPIPLQTQTQPSPQPLPANVNKGKSK
jgi:hypothetical protein